MSISAQNNPKAEGQLEGEPLPCTTKHSHSWVSPRGSQSVPRTPQPRLPPEVFFKDPPGASSLGCTWLHWAPHGTPTLPPAWSPRPLSKAEVCPARVPETLSPFSTGRHARSYSAIFFFSNILTLWDIFGLLLIFSIPFPLTFLPQSQIRHSIAHRKDGPPGTSHPPLYTQPGPCTSWLSVPALRPPPCSAL